MPDDTKHYERPYVILFRNRTEGFFRGECDTNSLDWAFTYAKTIMEALADVDACQIYDLRSSSCIFTILKGGISNA